MFALSCTRRTPGGYAIELSMIIHEHQNRACVRVKAYACMRVCATRKNYSEKYGRTISNTVSFRGSRVVSIIQ